MKVVETRSIASAIVCAKKIVSDNYQNSSLNSCTLKVFERIPESSIFQVKLSEWKFDM